MGKNIIRIISVLITIAVLSSCSVRIIPKEESATDIESDTDVKSELEKYSMVYYDYFDTVCTVIGYGDDPDKFSAMCDEVKGLLSRYNQLYDIYHVYDGIVNLRNVNNLAKDGPVEVAQEIIDLLLFSKDLYYKTEGMTNIAMGSVLSIWHEYREDGINDPENAKVPPMEDLLKASEHCNIEDIIIDDENNTVYFADPELKIDIGAVAKGYATERIAQVLISEGYDMVALNFGGNIRTIGGKADGSAWTAGVQNPDLLSDQKYLVNVGVSGMAFVTSGTYQRYYYVDDVRYHHIIHPDTLMPCHIFDSVSILTPDSGIADVLSTACFNLSLEEGKKLIKQFPDTEAMWVTTEGEIFYSDGFEKNITKYY